MRTRILLVDDNRAIRDTLRTLLGEQPDLEIVGEARDGAEGVTLAASLQPDVVLMDVNLPRVNGILATRRITRGCDGAVRVIGFSLRTERTLIQRMMRAGAS